MALPKNRKAVMEILDVLEPQILGKTRKGLKCSCGELHCADAVATEVEPSGDTYPGQETLWYLWHVRMEPLEEGHNGWSCGISEFVDVDELKALFEKHFGKPSVRREAEYILNVADADRVHAGLPAAVRINDNRDQIRFSINIGREQTFCGKLMRIEAENPRRMPAGSGGFLAVVSLMRTIQPEVYRGGPDPKLPFESMWHMDYDKAIDLAVSQANHIFLQGGGWSMDHRGSVYTSIDIVFMKYELK